VLHTSAHLTELHGGCANLNKKRCYISKRQQGFSC